MLHSDRWCRSSRMRSFVASLSLCLLALACGATTVTPGADGGVGVGNGGVTACGVQNCQPGSSCLNMACVPGCLSGSNCLTTEACEKQGGSDFGTCKTTMPMMMMSNPDAGPPPMMNCPAFCTKYQMCSPMDYMAGLTQCAQFKGRMCTCDDLCTAVSSACLTCFSNNTTCADVNDRCTSACR